jgi:hypothetical protein
MEGRKHAGFANEVFCLCELLKRSVSHQRFGMPTGAVLLVRSKVLLSEPALESARQQICSALKLSAEDFYLSGPLQHVANANEGPIPVHENAGFWYNLNIWRSYYGPGYERGDLPLFVKCAEWLEERFPDCEIWYGHDVNDENLKVFDSKARTELMSYYSGPRKDD